MRLAIFCCFSILCACECGGTGGTNVRAGPCAGSDPDPVCGRTCEDRLCPDGFYCDMTTNECFADCDAETGEGCGANAVCTREGFCQPRQDSGINRSDGPQMDGACPSVVVETRRVTPNVLLIVDQSGSMNEDFGGSDRWNALRDSLMDNPDGLVFSLQSQVRFGLALFTAQAEGNSAGPPIGMCPMVEIITPAIDNFGPIDAIYQPADPIDETPTGDSIDMILDTLLGAPDPSDDPTIFILATDGEPDRCEELNPQNGQDEALAAVERAYDAGIRTFIISVGEGTISDEHLQDVANAGVGVRGGDPDAPFYVAGDDDGLRDSLRAIIGGELSCVVELDGVIDPAAACEGSVVLNGRELDCDDPNGWEAIDGTHIEILGDSCDELQDATGATLEANFPCDVILI